MPGESRRKPIHRTCMAESSIRTFPRLASNFLVVPSWQNAKFFASSKVAALQTDAGVE
jgi:hypothetical protein